MSRAAPRLLVLLTLSQTVLGVALWKRTTENHTVYVMTPLVDVVPGGNPLDRSEAEALVLDVRHQAEARDMQRAFGWLGSTLSLDDLLRGVEALDGAGAPLSEAQAVEVAAILNGAKQQHARIHDVQSEALEAEAEIQSEIEAIATLLPPAEAQRVRATVAKPGPAPGGGRPPPGAPSGAVGVPAAGAVPGVVPGGVR